MADPKMFHFALLRSTGYQKYLFKHPLMGNFPATINLTTFQQKGGDVRTVYIATLGNSPTGVGNAVVVPKDSTVTTLTDLKGKQVSVPFSSAAHGMLLKAFKGWEVFNV